MAESLDDLPRKQMEFIGSCVSWHQTERHIFVHASAEPDRELSEQDDDVLFWQHVHSAPPRHQSRKVMICGHTPQPSGMPKNWGAAVCIDTGSGRGGWLTGLDVWTGHYWQTDEMGRSREGDIEPWSEAEEEIRI